MAKKFKKFARENLPFGKLIFGKGKKGAVPVVEEEEEEEVEEVPVSGMKRGGRVKLGAHGAASDKAKRGAGAVAKSRPWANRA